MLPFVIEIGTSASEEGGTMEALVSNRHYFFEEEKSLFERVNLAAHNWTFA